MSTTTHKQILIGALNFFGDDSEKWLKSNLHNTERTKACLLGGIILSAERRGIDSRAIWAGGNEIHRRIYMKAWDLVNQRAMARGFDGIPEFNNNPDTTFEDIKSVLAEAIQTVDA